MTAVVASDREESGDGSCDANDYDNDNDDDDDDDDDSGMMCDVVYRCHRRVVDVNASTLPFFYRFFRQPFPRSIKNV